ncbi:MAG: DUF4198 domain-containing protein [Pseudomonadota bacterium]
MLLQRLLFAVFVCIGSVATAHEFWIEPDEFQVGGGLPITANLRNGENFKGISLGWFENRFTRFEVVNDGVAKDVDGRMGDTPALQMTAPDDGLLVILHETTPQSLRYKEWNKFLKFVAHKDFSGAVSTHAQRNWSKSDFREVYTRHAKALVGVGTSEGTDRAFGMQTEFVALSNPYAAEFDGTMKVQLMYQGAPRADVQVEVFERDANNLVDITFFRTDTDGLASVPVRPGYSYLFDAVVLRPAEGASTQEGATVWETLWAALTFAVPSRER